MLFSDLQPSLRSHLDSRIVSTMIPNHWPQHLASPENPGFIPPGPRSAPQDLPIREGTRSEHGAGKPKNSYGRGSDSGPSAVVLEKGELTNQGSPDRSSTGISGEMSDFGGEKGSAQQNEFYPDGSNSGSDQELAPHAVGSFLESDLSKLVAQMQKVNAWAGPEATAVSSASARSNCQVYLTFPAHSTFTEDDVKQHFSKWGDVEDVRIPLKEKRNFGFVTFTSPVPVKAILSSEAEHKVKGIVVLVKPYCEKGKPSKAKNNPRNQPRASKAVDHTQSRNQRRAQQYTAGEELLELAAAQSGGRPFLQGLPVRYGGMFPAGSAVQTQASLLLLQQNQLQQAQKQILHHKQQEQAMQQQIEQLQMRIQDMEHTQQQKAFWKDSPSFNDPKVGMYGGGMNPQFGGTSPFERGPGRLEHAHSIDSTFGKVAHDEDPSAYRIHPESSSLPRSLSGSVSFSKADFALPGTNQEPSSDPRKARNLPDSLLNSGADHKMPPPKSGEDRFPYGTPQQEASGVYPVGGHTSSFAWTNGEFEGQGGVFFPPAAHGFRVPNSDSCQTCGERHRELLVLDCSHAHCASCFNKELSSVCPLCHAPATVSSGKPEQPWLDPGAQAYHPYHHTGGNQGGWQ